jgi:hypothetical protein
VHSTFHTRQDVSTHLALLTEAARAGNPPADTPLWAGFACLISSTAITFGIAFWCVS